MSGTRVGIGLLLAIALAAAAARMLSAGLYGLTLFLLLPMVLGGLSVWVFRPATVARAGGLGALTVLVASGVPVVAGLEGMGCLLMALPLTLFLGAVGGLAMFREDSVPDEKGAAMLLLLPAATLLWDAKAPPPVYAVRTQMTVAARPEQVWKYVIRFPPLAEPREWFFQGGIAYPIRARIEGSGPGAVRYCEFSTGAFVEPIEVWDEPRLLQFRVTANPAPMREWSPIGLIEPKHLHGYMVSKQGQFLLTRLANGSTLLEGTTWYQHGLWPAMYWRWWSDAIIHRIHLRVLNHVRMLAEQDARGLGR